MRYIAFFFSFFNCWILIKNILLSLSDNPDISIKNVIGILRVLKHEYIRGKISKDQYDILKENIADVIKDLISKKPDSTTKDKE